VNAGSEGRTVLYFVRHGEADSNFRGTIGGHSPVALTERGHRQAALTAEALVRAQPTAVVSSDLVRATQTADPIARATGHALELDPGLRERSLGVFDGLAFTEAEARYPEAWKRLMARDAEHVPEGGESTDAVYQRVSAAIDRLIARHAGGRVVVVTHGLALFHAFSHVCGLGSPSGHKRVFVLVDNCSITQVEHRFDDRDDRWRIVRMNDVGHLRELEDAEPPPSPPHARH
jgi:2,3-bisphosphoglycerate-dependent phosphoglycerate mutase